MKTFKNTVLGLTWKERGDAPDWQNIFLRRETYKMGEVPHEDIRFLTMAVDVQKDWLEYEVVGWAADKRNWSITKGQLLGDTQLDETWMKLDFYVQASYPIVDSTDEMSISLTVIDSGFNSQKVYEYCKKYPRSRVLPIKGNAKLMAPVQSPRAVDLKNRLGQLKRRGMKVWSVGVNILKAEVYGYLKQPPLLEGEAAPRGWYHFPEYDEEYFKQLTAEQLVKVKNKKGYFEYQWTKVRARNEALDLKVYNRAASIILGIDRLSESELDRVHEKTKVAKTKKITENKKTRKKPRRKKRPSQLWD